MMDFVIWLGVLGLATAVVALVIRDLQQDDDEEDA